jgi:hypothetical protein
MNMEDHPFDLYIEAKENFDKKNNSVAADLLAKAMGGDKPTYQIISSLSKIFNKSTLQHKLILNLISYESNNRRK